MRVFLTGSFNKDRRDAVSDAELVDSAKEIAAGLVEASLGAYLFKKRIARKGKGKSSGYRAVVAFRVNDRIVYLHLFAKNEKANITKKEFEALKALAKQYMELTALQLDAAVAASALLEIK